MAKLYCDRLLLAQLSNFIVLTFVFVGHKLFGEAIWRFLSCWALQCLQCFDAVGWATGRASGLQKLSGRVLAWLSVWSEVRTCIRPS